MWKAIVALLVLASVLVNVETHAQLASAMPKLAVKVVAAPNPKLNPIRLGMIEGLSGPFANAGEAVLRNLQWAVENINARGGVHLPDGQHALLLSTFDNKQGVEDSLTAFKHLTDQQIPFVLQGNSSAVALALVDAINKHNERTPDNRVLLLNYSAVDSSLTNEKCSYWHFRFDANAAMRMHVLTDVIRDDKSIKKLYLIGQDYSFGRQVGKAARAMLSQKRPDIQIVGEDLHPIGKIKDFAPYVAKIKASGADAVVTGNWGNDLTLLIKASKDAGMNLKFYTFYANSLGAPAAIGDAGVGQVRAVAEWHANAGDKDSDVFYQQFRLRYPDPKNDFVLLRVQVMMEMLVAAIEKAGSTEAAAVARALEGARYANSFYDASMRAADHQLIQPLYVFVMQKSADAGLRFDTEGSGYGFKTERRFSSGLTALPSSCKMARPN